MNIATYSSREAIAFCLECTHNHCNGLCPEFIQRFNGASKTGLLKSSQSYNGKMISYGDISLVTGLSQSSVRHRLNRGATVESIMEKYCGSGTPSVNQCKDIKARLLRFHADSEMVSKLPVDEFSSLGMVSHYGRIVSSPTNRITSITEDSAFANARFANSVRVYCAFSASVWEVWDALVLENQTNPSNHLSQKMFIMEHRVFLGENVSKLQSIYSEEHGVILYSSQVYRITDLIVLDVARVAMRRNFFGTSVGSKTKKISDSR